LTFIVLAGFFALAAYVIAEHKRTLAIRNETSADRYLRLAAGNWKMGSPPKRFLALTTMKIEPNYASTMVNLEWNRLPVQAQIALANFQAIMEIDPDSITTETGE
jgi:hypothetical protein